MTSCRRDRDPVLTTTKGKMCGISNQCVTQDKMTIMDVTLCLKATEAS